MAKVEIYGAGDDLVEIEGDIYEEFNALSNEAPCWLAFSDGTILSINYGKEGIWRISQYAKGTAEYGLIQGTNIDEDYTDRATLTGDIRWVVYGGQCATAKS